MLELDPSQELRLSVSLGSTESVCVAAAGPYCPPECVFVCICVCVNPFYTGISRGYVTAVGVGI